MAQSANFIPRTVSDYIERVCIGFRYDEHGEKVFCNEKIIGERYCVKCKTYLSQPQTVGWGCGQLRQGIADHVPLDPWEI